MMAKGSHRKPKKAEDWPASQVDPEQHRAPENTGDNLTPEQKAIAFDAQNTASRVRGWDRQRQADAGRRSPEPPKAPSVVKGVLKKLRGN